MKTLAIAGIVCILLVSLVNAIGIGVSPSQIDFKDVLKGGIYSKELKIDNTGDQEITAVINISEHKDWFSFDITTPIPAKSSSKVKITLSVPDVPIGSYETSFHVGGLTAAQEGMGLIPGALIRCNITITDQEIIKGYVDKIVTRDVKIGQPVSFMVGYMNEGNVENSPNVKVTIGDQEIDSDFQVQAGETKDLTITYDEPLQKGNYIANVQVTLDQEVIGGKEVMFSVSDNSQVQQIQEPTDTVSETEGPNALIGSLIVAGILVIGLLIFFIFNRK